MTVPELLEKLRALAGRKVLIVGDVMLDRYLSGDAERISPEAPVPVVRVEEETLLPGGAGNVAVNIRALGGEAVLVGARGDDPEGSVLEQLLEQEGVGVSLTMLQGRPTTTKTRILARRQQVARVDRERTDPYSAEEYGAILGAVARLMPGCGALVLSDYRKGLVAAPLTEGLLRPASERKLPLLVDPKPDDIALYRGVTLLTPNAEEAGRAARMPVRTRGEITMAGRRIMELADCEKLVITLGERGMAVFEGPGKVSRIPTVARQVFDVTGAGDTVIAALALGEAAGLPLIAACMLANYAAGIVVGRVGAASATPDMTAEAIESLPPPPVEDWS
ncbi:MAG: D-glycero-beta-D-manno-heptose-7-phosphate kinase [Desulfovibrio sp.]|jgi:rfaE bifunctional protein kinase chain/domain|nr:D-glycero-beta-D-manno-heptose-7-phosphate kinase [Desulfovibrio sp.]